MAATHTPGPWVYGPEVGVDSTRIESGSGRVIGAIRTLEVTDWQHGHPIYSWSDEGASNARLIAAAPELLEIAINEAEYRAARDHEFARGYYAKKNGSARNVQKESEDWYAGYDARAAIAKATGGASC